MSKTGEDPRNAQLAALAAENRELRTKLDATEYALTQAREALASAQVAREHAESASAARADLLNAEEVFVLRTRMRFNGQMLDRGERLPFDPTRPPEGCGGLIEGQHYERARIFVREAAA